MQPEPIPLPNKDQSIGFYVKISSIFLVELITVTFGFIPLCVTGLKSNAKFLSYSNAFSGGLFMGIGLFHLLPEANQLIFQGKDPSTSFPLGYFVAFLSYSLILCIEKVLFDSQSLTDHYDADIEPVLVEVEAPSNDNKKPLLIDYGNSRDKLAANVDKDIEVEPDISEETIKNVVTSKGKFVSFLHARNMMSKPNLSSQYDKSLIQASQIVSAMKKEDEAPDVEKRKASIDKREQRHSFDYMDHVTSDFKCKPASSMTPYILLIALSLHGLFEGTALGVQSKAKDAIFIAVAILAHKWAEGFALGISFVNSKTDQSTFVKMIILFSIFTPLGIAIGMMFAAASAMTQGVMLSVSAGTFLYVSASEVIIEEFAVSSYKGMKFFMYLIGGMFVACLTYGETFQGTSSIKN